VIDAPRLGPVSNPGHVKGLEGSTPSFTVNTMKYGDLLYFVPKVQNESASNAATVDDCYPYVCTVIGASNVGGNCDTTYSGSFTDTCELRARCDPANEYNGGCGAGGTCARQVPTYTSASLNKWTGVLNGTNFVAASGTDPATGKIVLPSMAVPTTTGAGESYAQEVHVHETAEWPVSPGFPTAWYLATCFVPAGAIYTDIENVQPLQDMLTIIKEPTDKLLSAYTFFQYNVQELLFTQPQQGTYGTPTFATGDVGDIIVLQIGGCTDVHSVSAASYSLDNPTSSSRFTLSATGGEVTGDEKGGQASVYALAQGKVNELAPGMYALCYATASSEGEEQSDFFQLTTIPGIEILPPPSTSPKLSVPRTVLLGQALIVQWESNVGLQTRVTPPNTWIGLYEAGECSDDNSDAPHQCYKAFQFLPTNEVGGTVIFSQQDYKVAGDYDIRYFVGDSRNGQGEVCKGMTGVDHETYIHCILNAAVTSSSIHIHGPDLRDMEDLESTPGMEVVFAGNRGRFN